MKMLFRRSETPIAKTALSEQEQGQTLLPQFGVQRLVYSPIVAHREQLPVSLGVSFVLLNDTHQRHRTSAHKLTQDQLSPSAHEKAQSRSLTSIVAHLLPLRVGELGDKFGQGVHAPYAPDHEHAILAGKLNLAGAKHELVLLLHAQGSCRSTRRRSLAHSLQFA